MVLKLSGEKFSYCAEFENDVIWYGTQTHIKEQKVAKAFENDVIWYGTQTSLERNNGCDMFENDVIWYGTQTSRLGIRNRH